jgi:hypothetical protein
MSSTNRGGKRNEADFYETPAWCVEWLLKAWQPLPALKEPWRPPRIIEPCAGRGAIIGACNAAGLRAEWTANEDDYDRAQGILQSGLTAADRCFTSDFLTWPRHGSGLPSDRFDYIITNPPFSLAQEFVEKAMGVADVTVMLLRLNFLGSQKRAKFLRSNMPDVYILSKRPSFTGKGTDSTEYAWFVWDARTPRRTGRIMVLSGE